MSNIEGEWRDICDGVHLSGLVTWQDWIDMGKGTGMSSASEHHRAAEIALRQLRVAGAIEHLKVAEIHALLAIAQQLSSIANALWTEERMNADRWNPRPEREETGTDTDGD